MVNLKNLHVAASAYLQANNSWPQIPISLRTEDAKAYARQWVAGNVEPQGDENTPQVQQDGNPFLNLRASDALELVRHVQRMSPGAVVSIPRNGMITFETVQSFAAVAPRTCTTPVMSGCTRHTSL